MGLETPDDTSIEGLDVRSQVWLEWDQFDVLRNVCDIMAREVIESESDMPILIVHLLIEALNESKSDK